MHDAVYCSCRCANAKGAKDDGAQLLRLSERLRAATKLIDDLGFGVRTARRVVLHQVRQQVRPDRGRRLECSALTKTRRNAGKNP